MAKEIKLTEERLLLEGRVRHLERLISNQTPQIVYGFDNLGYGKSIINMLNDLFLNRLGTKSKTEPYLIHSEERSRPEICLHASRPNKEDIKSESDYTFLPIFLVANAFSRVEFVNLYQHGKDIGQSFMVVTMLETSKRRGIEVRAEFEWYPANEGQKAENVGYFYFNDRSEILYYKDG